MIEHIFKFTCHVGRSTKLQVSFLLKSREKLLILRTYPQVLASFITFFPSKMTCVSFFNFSIIFSFDHIVVHSFRKNYPKSYFPLPKSLHQSSLSSMCITSLNIQFEKIYMCFSVNIIYLKHPEYLQNNQLFNNTTPHFHKTNNR